MTVILMSTCPLLISMRQIMLRTHPYLRIAYLTKFSLRSRQPISLGAPNLTELYLTSVVELLLLTLQSLCITQPTPRNYSSTSMSHGLLIAYLFDRFTLKTVGIRSLAILGHAAVKDAGTYLLTALLSIYHHLLTT